MKALAVDLGRTHVKVIATGESDRRGLRSELSLFPKRMVAGLKKLA